MTYKNVSLTKKEFYGVVFKPGETKQVPGYVNDPKMIRVADTVKSEVKPKSVDENKPTKPKQGGKTNGSNSDQ